MSESAAADGAAGSADESRTPNEGRTNGDRSADAATDGMRIEIGSADDGYISVSAGRTIAALVAVVGAVAIVAILAHPRLLRAATGASESGGDGEVDGADGATEEASVDSSRRGSAPDESER